MVFIWQRLCYDTEMPYNNLKISEFKMSPLKNVKATIFIISC